MKQRVISAIVLLTITLGCVLASEVSRILFFAAAGIICCYELSRNLEKLEIYCCAWVMYVHMAIQAVLTLLHAPLEYCVAALTLAIFLAMFSGILHPRVSGPGAFYTEAGVSYPGFLFVLLMRIGDSDIWAETLLLAVIPSMLCDAFALFGGMRFGKHKLAPRVSPKKTWEGSISGALAAIAAGFALYYLLPLIPGLSYTGIPLWVCVLTAFLSSSMGQIGDLAESLVKRMIGVKDFSNLIPGHGGLMDRADSLLFAIPTAYLCLLLAQRFIG
ncbi:MAG: phosphatidate cytidylyltransferase [Oscillospiraceae bacterium]|nr:phosphatidate cytidylyltransferase [Oscillospiraceae bacterium]